jgi:hypothetical protein
MPTNCGTRVNPANPTVPWVAWDEDLGGVKQVFVSRLVGSGASAHFQLVNNGAPISTGANDSTRPDITFSGNTPYVSWREDIGGGVVMAFAGHFVNPANPTFVLDESSVPLTPTAQADVREPISSSCIATPFNADGAACQGGAVGTPFFLFTNGTSPRALFADAYQQDAPVTGAASGITTLAATLSGTVNPQGASVDASFEYGTTTAYGQSTAAQKLAPTNAATPFTAQLAGLPAGTTIHYRAVAASDFGKLVGGDQTLTTSPLAPGTTKVGHAKVSGTNASVRIACAGAAGAKCTLALSMSVTETFKGHKLIAVTARDSGRRKHKVVVVGTASVALSAGKNKTVRISLNRTGRKLLATRNVLEVKLRVTEALGNRRTVTVSTQTVTFKTRNRRRGHPSH